MLKTYDKDYMLTYEIQLPSIDDIICIISNRIHLGLIEIYQKSNILLMEIFNKQAIVTIEKKIDIVKSICLKKKYNIQFLLGL